MDKQEAIQVLADLTDNLFLHTWEEQYKALHMAIEALSGEAGWIPCSESLPAKRRSVLITTSEGFVGEACYWETTENHVIWKGYRWNATYWDDEIIAWMPLPKPYREDGEEE